MNLKFRKNALAARICLVLLTGGVPQILSASEAMEVVQQSSAINGVVVDEAGEPIIGANILQKGTTNGTITDFDGKFSLNVPAQATITVTYVTVTFSVLVASSQTSDEVAQSGIV